MDIKNEAGEMLTNLINNSSMREDLTDNERIGIAVGGAVLTIIGLRKLGDNKGVGLTLAALGGGLVASAINGKNPLFMLNDKEKELKAKATCTIKNLDRKEVYYYWRNLENLPLFMEHLEKVNTTGEKQSHWKAAFMEIPVEWDAEIISDIEGELIAWKSLAGSDIQSEGRVEFVDAPDGGTKINVEMKYADNSGALVKGIVSTFNSTFEDQLNKELKKLKQTLEKRGNNDGSNNSRSADPLSGNTQNIRREHEHRQQQQFQQQKQENLNR